MEATAAARSATERCDERPSGRTSSTRQSQEPGTRENPDPIPGSRFKPPVLDMIYKLKNRKGGAKGLVIFYPAFIPNPTHHFGTGDSSNKVPH